MLVVGIVLLILASFLHCWYGVNSRMPVGHAAGAFFRWGSGIVVAAMAILIVGLGFIWGGSSFLWLIVGLIVYFAVLPFIFTPLLERIYRPAPPGVLSHAGRSASDAEWAKVTGLNEPVRDHPVAKDFWLQLYLLLQNASESGDDCVDVQAGELHRRTGWYPGPTHRMPVCCRVMREEMRDGDTVLDEPEKGAGASLTIRYRLPRPED
ncbi:hypothetical protein [Edaphobacter acidisoli]|uniref:hypothetical protein n=1 Tax=Edaphobacter acidisoli TaxID=2040573 RepID=UPI001E4995D8|nr:hypothetical protein [Edaphobacter acidisoli]